MDLGILSRLFVPVVRKGTQVQVCPERLSGGRIETSPNATRVCSLYIHRCTYYKGQNPRRRYLAYVTDGVDCDTSRFACKWWTANLHQNASLTTTHDLGFMIFPWARVAWELNHDVKAYETIIRASRSLASRYSPSVGAFRSWDTCVTKRYSFQNPAVDFLVIIVSHVYSLIHLPESFRTDMRISPRRTG